MKNTFERIFAARTVLCFFVFTLMMLLSVLRIGVIAASDYGKKAQEQSSIRIEVARLRGSILDKNGLPLVNGSYKTVAAILPTKSAIAAVKSGILENEDQDEVIAVLESGNPAVCYVKDEIDCDGITSIKIPVRYESESAAHHAVGCTDYDGNGTSGIESAYNELLKTDEALYAEFAIDGKGNCLLGVKPTFNTESALPQASVTTTIDINVQKTVEKLTDGIEKGAVIVCECKTGKIRAMLSLPDFSPQNISDVLNNPASPLINRCLLPYSVGSVFKPTIAAAAMENGYGDFTAFCTGKTEIESRVFNCHKRDGHGAVDIKNALKQSCNCFFYNLAGSMSSDIIYYYAKLFNFGSRIKIGDNIYSEGGNIPNKGELLTLSDKANFGIGQGDISLCPVSLLNLYNAIANGGEYVLPSIIEKTSENGKNTAYETAKPTRAIKKETAKMLKEYLSGVLEDGTGAAAKSEKVTAAGKTATAQTGQRDESGKEINNSWFCGFFPLESPRYTVIIMSDGNFKTAPSVIFKRISEAL